MCCSNKTMQRALILAILHLAFCLEASAKFSGQRVKRADDDDGPDYPVEEYLENCGMTHTVAAANSFKFVSPYFGDYQYPEDMTCNWTFIGHESCHPALSCTDFDLRKNDQCDEEYLEVRDGLGGSERFCGNMKGFDGLKATKGGRDLFVKFQTMQGKFDKLYTGFICEIKCDGGKKALKEDPSPKRKEDSRCICGFQNGDDRIVGGEDALMNEFPWMAAIVSKGTRAPICGGSIINNQWVLTAAHCFVLTNKQADEIDVLFHAHTLDMTMTKYYVDKPLGEKGSIRGSGYNAANLTDEDESTIRIGVAQIINHPFFTAKYDYDVALLRLEQKVDFTAPNSPIPLCLPDPGLYEETFEGKIPKVVGWGLPHQDAGGTTRVLQKLDVPIIVHKVCQELMPTTLTQRMMCAGYIDGGMDACMGDSGGPLAVKDPQSKQWTQIGIVSWGEGCARKGRPGIYSRLTELVQWVYNHAEKANWCLRKKS